MHSLCGNRRTKTKMIEKRKTKTSRSNHHQKWMDECGSGSLWPATSWEKKHEARDFDLNKTRVGHLQTLNNNNSNNKRSFLLPIDIWNENSIARFIRINKNTEHIRLTTHYTHVFIDKKKEKNLLRNYQHGVSKEKVRDSCSKYSFASAGIQSSWNILKNNGNQKQQQLVLTKCFFYVYILHILFFRSIFRCLLGFLIIFFDQFEMKGKELKIFLSSGWLIPKKTLNFFFSKNFLFIEKKTLFKNRTKENGRGKKYSPNGQMFVVVVEWKYNIALNIYSFFLFCIIICPYKSKKTFLN